MIRTIFCDLDGVLIRRYCRQKKMGDLISLASIFSLLESLEKKKENPRIIFVTNRPCSILPPFVWMYKGARYHAGEGGAVIFDRDCNLEIPDIRFNNYCQNIRPALIDWLKNNVEFIGRNHKLFPEFLGNKVNLSIEIPKDSCCRDFSNVVLESLRGFPYKDELDFDIGSIPSIIPKSLTKEFAFARLFDLYKEINEPIIPEYCYWIADNDRDISFGKMLKNLGGQVCAVGNSSPVYLDFVRSVNGICVQGEYEKGFYQILFSLF